MAIEHDPIHQRFFARLGAYEACLMYAQQDGVLDFYHIYTPVPFRNTGVSGRILVAAFEYARQAGLRVVPSCPYIATDFLPRFPQYQDLVESGEFPFARRG